jgi:predicted nucleic acid-binding protein
MSGTKYLLDTNALYFLFQGKLKEKVLLKDLSLITISIITEIEFLSNKNLTPNDKSLFQDLKKLITSNYISEKEKDIITQTIFIRKKYKLKTPDAIIAATAIVNNCTLLNGDSDFSKVFNLKFILIKP